MTPNELLHRQARLSLQKRFPTYMQRWPFLLRLQSGTPNCQLKHFGSRLIPLGATNSSQFARQEEQWAMAPSTAALSPAAFSSFGELLRYLRRRQRLTQIELAIAVGYSTAQISRLEQNQRRPNPSTVQALFIPALGLEHEPGMVARVLELARAARDQRDADAWLSDLGSADTAGLSGQGPGSARDQQNMLDSEPS